MSTNFPASLDTTTQLPSILSTDVMDTTGKEHDVMHTNLATAVLALETKVGADGSTDTTSLTYKVSNAGTRSYFGTGAPATFHNDGDLYFDITNTSSFSAYVQQTGILPATLDTVTSGNYSSVASGSATYSITATQTLIIVALSYENSGNTAMSSAVTSPHLTWTKYTTAHSSYSGNQYTDIWYAQPTGALASEVISWTFSGGSVDNGVWFIIPLEATIASGGNPFADSGTGFPIALSTTGASEVTSGTVTAGAGVTLIAITAKDTSGLPGYPIGFTSVGTASNGGGSLFEYATVGKEQITSAFSGTITSSGISGVSGNMVVLAISNNPTYRSWVAFT